MAGFKDVGRGWCCTNGKNDLIENSENEKMEIKNTVSHEFF